jgi:hypothetical protein
MNNLNICIADADALGTTLGNVLATKDNLGIQLLSVEENAVNDINSIGIYA